MVKYFSHLKSFTAVFLANLIVLGAWEVSAGLQTHLKKILGAQIYQKLSIAFLTNLYLQNYMGMVLA